MAMHSLAPLHLKRRPTPGVYARSAPVLEPNEAPPCSVAPWEATAPVRPDTAHVRAPRFLDLAGELITGLAIIAGGVLAYGFMPVA